LCRAFPTTLKGATLNWITWLPPLSINYFDTFVAKFKAQFATTRPHHLTSIVLVNTVLDRALMAPYSVVGSWCMAQEG